MVLFVGNILNKKVQDHILEFLISEYIFLLVFGVVDREFVNFDCLKGLTLLCIVV